MTDYNLILFMNDAHEIRPPPRALCLLPSALLLVKHTLDKVNFLPTLPHPLTVFINLPLQKWAANLKLRSRHLVNLMPWDPDRNCYGSEVTVWPRAYQSCVYLKSMCGNGRQQTEGPQAMEQFGGKSCVGIQIRACAFRSVYSR